MYKLLAGDKIRFLDDILTFLESSVEQQNADMVASASCYNYNKDKFFGITYSFKPFITQSKEHLYLRVAMLHLEKKGLIHKYPNLKNIELPIYLISYSGLILVRNGGYCKKIVLDRLKEFLQRLAWFFTILGLLLNAYIYRDKLTFFSDTSTNPKTEVKDILQKQTKVFQQ
ncbi:hypothetical protein [Flavobacterium sp. Arc2]|uniref:hypothetical protein n=1 Tax=Flavobacterium sp. Arc2 TaxID=3046685 RepID=UPI00352E7E04